MDIKMRIKNNVLTLTFTDKLEDIIISRMHEMEFKSEDNRSFSRAKFLSQSEYDYIKAIAATQGLGMAYIPASEKGFILDTEVPDTMGQEMHIAVRKIKKSVGGSFIQYLCEKLDYTEKELVSALACEQIDAVSLAIHNIEKKQGIIIGDQTGIGKGRTAAAIIRYAIKQGMKPIFLSEKPNLFSDLYRDMVDIHSAELKPFIVNARASKTHVKDKDGDVVYQAPVKSEQLSVFKLQNLPDEYDYVCATYSQFSKAKEVVKRGFLCRMAENNVIVLDEAHNASGASQTGDFMTNVVKLAKGVAFLSATFAKRPDNMPIYSVKTAMKEANLTSEGLVEAIVSGGVALQEVLSSQLVATGQMIRRERSFDGVAVNYIELEKKSAAHKEIADNITRIIRDIIKFQDKAIDPVIDEMDKVAAKEGAEVTERNGTSKAGCDNVPAFSKLFNIINQMLFSINAEDVADHTIQLCKDGKKPIVAFASTMGSFLEDMGEVGDIVNADFAMVLEKALKGTLRYTVKTASGKSLKKSFDISEFDGVTQNAYYTILNDIKSVSTGIYISPIDIIKQKIIAAGYTVGEVTGRSIAVEYGDFEVANEASEDMPLTFNDIPALVKKVMPIIQQQVIVGSVEHWRTLEVLNQQIKNIPKLGSPDGKKEYEAANSNASANIKDYYKPKLHFFYGSSDWYITEWDGKDTLFGFAILGGDMQCAEWGYMSLSEILDYQLVELDFYFDDTLPLSSHLKSKGLGILNVQEKLTNITSAQIIKRPKENVVDAFRKYNNNEVDILLINQSGSTGASAHAVTTDKVARKDVKPRVMVILQAELDISTEIQKRGRINRTGQVEKPQYDYIISSIPAQKRMLMMLKKKLKSLDANTTSNQENSGKQLESEDFLNKYGDKVVYEYMTENPELCLKLDDPLKLFNEKSEDVIIGAALKVSGRVAVLPVQEQEKFYNDIIKRYNTYVALQKQQGSYDLQVETLNLKAEVLESSVLVGGKGGKTAFGDDTIIQKVEANILAKPLFKDELAKELAKKPKDHDYVNLMQLYYTDKLVSGQSTYIGRFEDKVDQIKNEKGYKKADNKSEYIKDRTAELREDMNAAISTLEKQKEVKEQYMSRYFRFFDFGGSYRFPAIGNPAESVAAIFLGFNVDLKANNPYAPSAVSLRFAVADSRRLMVLTCSGDAAEILNSVMSRSLYINEDYVANWINETARYAKARGIRYIIGGNLLQACGKINEGKLISYTTKSRKVEKGLLMPESWSPAMNENSRVGSHVITPINSVSKHILSLTVGSSLKTENDISIIKNSLDDYLITMPKRKTHIPIYTDADIVKLLVNNKDGFEMVSGMMRAYVSSDKMPKLIKVLGESHSISVEVARSIYDKLFENKKINKHNDLDKLTKEAMSMFEEDKSLFDSKLDAQKRKLHTKPKEDKARKLKRLRMRAKAIRIMQMQ